MSFGEWMPVPDVPFIAGYVRSDGSYATVHCIGCGLDLAVDVPNHMMNNPFPWELIGAILKCPNCNAEYRFRVMGFADPEDWEILDGRAVLERIFQERGL